MIRLALEPIAVEFERRSTLQTSENSKQTGKSSVGLLKASGSQGGMGNVPACENCGALIIDDRRAANRRDEHPLVCIVCGHSNQLGSMAAG